MATSEKTIRVEESERIGIITLDGRGPLNILDTRMLKELADALTLLEEHRKVRVVIITGTKNFCAGADIQEMKDKTPREAEAFSRLGHKVCSLIEEMGKIVIAAINGYALGGGCEIALSCDLRIATANARFGQPELNIGVIPGFGATQRLPRFVGIGRAKEMILTGRIVEANEAASFGLADMVVKEEQLLERARELAEVIAQKSPLTVEMVKMLINGTIGTGEGLEEEIRSFAQCFGTEDHAEGIKAFLEKRKPTFKGT